MRKKRREINKKKLFVTRYPLFIIPIYIAFLITLSGCSPTYPGAEVPKYIEKICKEEYNLAVKVKVVGKTVGVYLPLESLLDSSLKLSPEIGKKVENVVLAVHRVTLSTDKDISFYVIIASDTKQIGAEFTLIGFIKDIKRARLLDISRSEYRQRLIRDLKLNPKALGDKDGAHFLLSEISLPRFLAEQISRRIKSRLKEEGWEVGSVEWRFGDGGFKFVIDSAFEKTIVSQAIEIIAHVFHGYRFEDFYETEISTAQDKRKLTLDKKDLELFRQKKITLEELI